MNERTKQPGRRHRVAATVCATAVGVALVLGIGAAASATSGSPHQVTLCHATNSATNPYVVITVDVASVLGDKGHGGHTGPVFDPSVDKHDQPAWGDIIPAFDYGPGEQYAGLNVDAGSGWLDNGCTGPGDTTTTSTSTTTTSLPICPTCQG